MTKFSTHQGSYPVYVLADTTLFYLIKKRRKLSFLFLLGLIITGCQPTTEKKKVDAALAQASVNAAELHAVLKHYRHDDLKYRAACFLIANMTDHYADHSIDSLPDLVPKAFRAVDSLSIFLHDSGDSLSASENDLLADQTVKQWADSLLGNISFVKQKEQALKDLHSLKAEWLIDHIDNAFDVWQKSYYAQNMPFEEFKETLLTYRSRNEALDVNSSWIKTIMWRVLKPDIPGDIHITTEQFNRYTFDTDCFEDDGRHLGNFGFYDILQFYQYECGRHSEWTVRALNAAGIPARFHFTPAWLNRDRHHFWVAVRDTAGVYHPFTPKWQSLDDTAYFKRASKVYTRTYEKQPSPVTRSAKNEEVPPIFKTPFIKDVTRLYHKVADLKIPVEKPDRQNNLCYLAIFGASGWKPVGWGIVDRKRGYANFSDVPIGVVYIAGYYSDNGIEPFTPPFYLDSNGVMAPFIPDYRHPTDLHLTRKFHKKDDLVKKAFDMAGARIQGANRRDFSDAEELYSLIRNDLTDMNVRALDIQPGRDFHYIRLLPPEGKKLNLAIFEAFSGHFPPDDAYQGTMPYACNEAEENRLRHTRPLSAISLKPLSDTAGYSLLWDGNMETFLETRQIELDLQKPTRISQLRLAPRNANNGIERGCNYELLYYDKGWKSAGKKSAGSNYLTWPGIPSGALYWLRNLDKGKEEQAFIWQNGKQVFVNHDPWQP